MFRRALILSAICLLLTVTTIANEAPVLESRPQRAEVLAAASGLPASAWACSAPEVTVPYNTEYYWRWEAYRQLDCSIEVIERAMKQSADSEEGTLTLTREELEQLRTRAFWAKDAAARIGR
jgi:hypothetical protein